jgi:transmembrane sensor
MKPNPGTTPVPPVKWEDRPLDWPRAAGEVDRLLEALKLRERRQRRRRIAAAASAVLLVLCGTWFVSDFRPNTESVPAVAGQKYRIASPERLTLPDGSLVELQPGAELAVKFLPESTGPRRVELVKGVAFFQVAKNPDRPFIVSSGGVSFRAVGTAFSVGLGQSSVEMIVTEGRVAIDEAPTQAKTRDEVTMVAAGNRAVVDLVRPATLPIITPTTQADVSRQLAWRVPRLEFNETPLSEVVSLLNQHSGNRLSLASPELGRVEISGALRADNIEPLLQMIEANYGIRAARGTDGRIELQRGK